MFKYAVIKIERDLKTLFLFAQSAEKKGKINNDKYIKKTRTS
jgi:hypothetical protein